MCARLIKNHLNTSSALRDVIAAKKDVETYVDRPNLFWAARIRLAEKYSYLYQDFLNHGLRPQTTLYSKILVSREILNASLKL